MRVRLGDQVLSLISTITVFGNPVDITQAELAIETFTRGRRRPRGATHLVDNAPLRRAQQAAGSTADLDQVARCEHKVGSPGERLQFLLLIGVAR